MLIGLKTSLTVILCLLILMLEFKSQEVFNDDISNYRQKQIALNVTRIDKGNTADIGEKSDNSKVKDFGGNSYKTTINTSSESVVYNPSAIITFSKSNYPQYKVFQRDESDEYDFNLTGTYSGVCSSIEASFDSNPYVIIDATPTGGTFSGTLANQGVGQGRLSVRCSNDVLSTDFVDDIGVGDVFVVAGQSNAEGNGLNAQQYSTVAPTASVFPTVYTQADAWKIGNDDTDPGGGPGSTWPIVGGYIAENTGVPVNFITTASGGTNLNTQWQPGNPIYNSFVTQVAEANPNKVKAVLWFQGESDVDDAISREAYNALLDQLIINFQTDAPGSPDLVPGIIGPRSGIINQINTTAIRLATQDAWEDNPLVVHGPQTYDIHIINDGEGDNIHFGTDEEIQTLAFRWWKALEEHYYGGAEGRGPQVIQAQMVEGNMMIDIDFNASSALQGGTSTAMWFVDDNGTERSVTNAVLMDTNTIRLTLSNATTSSNITLTYAKGNSGENQDVVTDSTTGNTAAGSSPLPADGFSDYPVTPASAPNPDPIKFRLKTKVFLEGPFNPITLLMNDNLRIQNSFPTTEPFTALGYVHLNGGGESITSGLLDITGNAAIVDWIFVEIRDGDDPENVIQTQSALVQRDGKIVSTFDASTLTFDYPDPSITSIIVSIKHRNHFGFRNLNPINIMEVVNLDFTQINVPLFGNPGLAAKLINGVKVMVTGDANNDGYINTVDKNLHWRQQNGNPYNYLNTNADFNLNGVVNAIDKNVYWRPNNARIEQND